MTDCIFIKTEKIIEDILNIDIHSSLHHQGACACVQAGLLQVQSFMTQDHPATPAAHLTEQHNGGQRKLLSKEEKKICSCIISLVHNDLITNSFEYKQILTCPVVCMERTVQSEDRKPMASALGYSPSSNTYMFSVN